MPYVPIQTTDYAPFITLGAGVVDSGTGYAVDAIDLSFGTLFSLITPEAYPEAQFRITFTAWTVDPGSAGDGTSYIEVDNQAYYQENTTLNLAGWSPNPATFASIGQVGIGVYDAGEGGQGTVQGAFTVEVDVPDPPPEPETCKELGRVTRAYVSGYQRDRVHFSSLVRGEKRCLVANFNGAIPASREIVSATWRCEYGGLVVMSDAKVTARDTSVNILAVQAYEVPLKCEATLDNGEVYVQLFVVRVKEMPWFGGESLPAPGPSVLTVTR